MTKDLRAAADAIDAVYRGAPPIEPLRHAFANPDVDTAYAIQEINTRRWLDEGRRLTGRKIGLTSDAVQQQLGVDQPDYGMLFADMAVDNHAAVPFGEVCQARIEGEIAFVVDRRLDDAGIDHIELESSMACALAAFEIVGSRVRNWDIHLFDTVADNASSGKYVLGAREVSLHDVDLAACRMRLKENGDLVSEGCGAACLGSPLNAALWLARKMASVGRPLEAGDVILSGALGPFVDVRADAVYELEIEGFDLVRVGFPARSI